MVNSQTIKEIIDALKIDTNIESVPNAVPVVEVNPKLVKVGIVKSATKTSSGSSTIYTTPTNQDFYLNSVCLAYTKDATCDVAIGSVVVSAVIGGVSTNLISIPNLTLTAESNSLSIFFKNPILIDKNTAIQVSGPTYTAGTMSKSGTITGFIDEVN